MFGDVLTTSIYQFYRGTKSEQIFLAKGARAINGWQFRAVSGILKLLQIEAAALGGM